MRRALTFLALLVATSSVALFLFARPAGRFVGAKLGSTILRVTNGKVADPAIFVSGRLREAALLAALGLGFCLLFAGIRRLLQRRLDSWAVLALVAFALVNLWFLAAMHSCLFWAALYSGGATSTITQFNFKRTLLKEHAAARQLILMGSSQTQSQIDENLLNEQSAGKLWTTELHFPGSRALDLLLVLRRLRSAPPADIVCYLSEYYFYPGLYTTTAPYFVSVADIPLLRRLGFGPQLATEPYGIGFLAEVLPLFACRDPIAQRLLGSATTSLAQARHDANLDTNLVRRAEEWVRPFKLNRDAALQKQAFLAFVSEAARQHRRLILLEGQVNPVLGERIPKELRSDMRAFLRAAVAGQAHVTLIPEEALPPQPPSSYQDLTHVTPAVQKQFTEWLVTYLRGLRLAER